MSTNEENKFCCGSCGIDLIKLQELTGKNRCWNCSRNHSRQPGEKPFDDYAEIPKELKHA